MESFNKTVITERILRSWLRAVDIVPDLPDILVVDDQTVLQDGVLCIPAGSLNRIKDLDTFHVVTEHIGKGRPIPVSRGEPPSRAEIYNQDFFLTVVRHRDFRNAPDLNKEKIKEYEPIVKRWASNFFYINRGLCAAHGYQKEDLLTFGWVWAHVFVHKGEGAFKEENRVLLNTYLKQRGAELYKILGRQLAAIIPEKRAAHFSLTGEVTEDLSFEEEPERLSPAYIASKKEMRKTLKERLTQLPHAKMVSALISAVRSPERDYATQTIALNLLKEHAATCDECYTRDFSRKSINQGRDEEVGVVYSFR